MRKPRKKRRRRPLAPFDMVGYALSIVYALLIALPIYFLVISSFKDTGSIISTPLSLPKSVSLSNFREAQRDVGMFHAMGISGYVTAGSEVVTLALAFPAAYALGRLRSKVSSVAEAFFGLGFLVPAFAILVPIFYLAAKSGLLNNPLVLILFYPALRLPLSVLVLTSFVRQIPRELEESAFVDGASKWQAMWRVFFPLCWPGIVTVVILNFVEIWNEYLFAFILLNAQDMTAQVAVPLLSSAHYENFGVLAAGAIITMVPVYLVFVFFQRRMTRGLLAGSIKG